MKQNIYQPTTIMATLGTNMMLTNIKQKVKYKNSVVTSDVCKINSPIYRWKIIDVVDHINQVIEMNEQPQVKWYATIAEELDTLPETVKVCYVTQEFHNKTNSCHKARRMAKHKVDPSFLSVSSHVLVRETRRGSHLHGRCGGPIP